MITISFRNSSIFIFIFSTLLLLSGCKKESNPVTPPTDHSEPEGWVISDATSRPILVVWQGVIQVKWDGLILSDTLYAPLNAVSDHLSIKFLNSEKKIFDPPASSDYDLGWVITDTSKLSIIQDSPSDYAIHLKGKKEGITSLELQLRHLGHTDARTPQIPVVIRKDSSAHGLPIGVRLSYESEGKVLNNANSKLEIRKDSTSKHIKVEFVDESGISQRTPKSGGQSVLSLKSLNLMNSAPVKKVKGLWDGRIYIGSYFHYDIAIGKTK